MFPHLDDIFLEYVTPVYNTWAHGGTRIQVYPQLRWDYLSYRWMPGFPLKFHTIPPGMLAKDEIPIFTKLVTMCVPTYEEYLTPSSAPVRDGLSYPVME